MLLIHCPYCEQDRPELEFAYAGEAHIARPADPSTLSDEEWRDFLFIRTNPRGHHFERWRHINGCARFFNAVRDTVRDRFLLTYKAGEPRPDLEALTEREPRSDLEKLIATEPRPSMAATEGRIE